METNWELSLEEVIITIIGFAYDVIIAEMLNILVSALIVGIESGPSIPELRLRFRSLMTS